MANVRQQKFCNEFLRTGNATAAAREAGYNPHSAASQGARLLKNANVRKDIAAKLERMDGQGVASAEQVMQFLTDVMRGRVKDQFGLDAALSDRLVAARELLRRLDVVDGRQGTLERLDGLLLEFRMAIYGDEDPDDENDDTPT